MLCLLWTSTKSNTESSSRPWEIWDLPSSPTTTLLCWKLRTARTKAKRARTKKGVGRDKRQKKKKKNDGLSPLQHTCMRTNTYKRGTPVCCLPPEALWFPVCFNLRCALARLWSENPCHLPLAPSHSFSPHTQTKPQMTTTCYLCHSRRRLAAQSKKPTSPIQIFYSFLLCHRRALRLILPRQLFWALSNIHHLLSAPNTVIHLRE